MQLEVSFPRVCHESRRPIEANIAQSSTSMKRKPTPMKRQGIIKPLSSKPERLQLSRTDQEVRSRIPTESSGRG
eukprot:6455450-Amphidinium_carterae.3